MRIYRDCLNIQGNHVFTIKLKDGRYYSASFSKYYLEDLVVKPWRQECKSQEQRLAICLLTGKHDKTLTFDFPKYEEFEDRFIQNEFKIILKQKGIKEDEVY